MSGPLSRALLSAGKKARAAKRREAAIDAIPPDETGLYSRLEREIEALPDSRFGMHPQHVINGLRKTVTEQELRQVFGEHLDAIARDAGDTRNRPQLSWDRESLTSFVRQQRYRPRLEMRRGAAGDDLRRPGREYRVFNPSKADPTSQLGGIPALDFMLRETRRVRAGEIERGDVVANLKKVGLSDTEADEAMSRLDSFMDLQDIYDNVDDFELYVKVDDRDPAAGVSVAHKNPEGTLVGVLGQTVRLQNGRRGTVVSQVQSDLAQRGRLIEQMSPEAAERRLVRIDELLQRLDTPLVRSRQSEAQLAEWRRPLEHERMQIQRKSAGTELGETRQWSNAALAAALRDASQRGDDFFAIPTGRTSAIVQGNAKASEFYDNGLPGRLRKMAQAFGGDVQKREIGGAELWVVDLNEKQRNDIVRKGFPMFGVAAASVTALGAAVGTQEEAEAAPRIRPNMLGFVSKLDETLAIEDATLPPQQWKKRLKKLGVTNDELQFRLGDLDDADGKLTAQEVSALVRPVRIEEHRASRPAQADYDERPRIVERARDVLDAVRHRDAPERVTVWGDSLSLPGGRNYREFALRFNDEAIGASDYSDAHFGGPGTFLHWRTDDRTVKGYGRTQFVMEVQSDMMQRARDVGGFTDPDALADARLAEENRATNARRLQTRVNALWRDIKADHPIAEYHSDRYLQQDIDSYNRILAGENRGFGAIDQIARTVDDAEFREARREMDTNLKDYEIVDFLVPRFRNEITQYIERLTRLANDNRMADYERLYSDLREARLPSPDAPGMGFTQPPFSNTWPQMAIRAALYEASRKGYNAIALPTPETAARIQGHVDVKKGIDQFYGSKLPKQLEKQVKRFGGKVETATVRAPDPEARTDFLESFKSRDTFEQLPNDAQALWPSADDFRAQVQYYYEHRFMGVSRDETGDFTDAQAAWLRKNFDPKVPAEKEVEYPVYIVRLDRRTRGQIRERGFPLFEAAAAAGGAGLAAHALLGEGASAQDQEPVTEEGAAELAMDDFLADLAVATPAEAEEAEPQAPADDVGTGERLTNTGGAVVKAPGSAVGFLFSEDGRTLATAAGRALVEGDKVVWAKSAGAGVIQGAVNAFNETAEFVDDVGDALRINGVLESIAKTTRFDPRIVTVAEGVEAAPARLGPVGFTLTPAQNKRVVEAIGKDPDDIPGFARPFDLESDPLGDSVEAMTRFTLGFLGAAKIKSLGFAKKGANFAGVMYRNVSRSFISGAVVMSDQEDRMADMLVELNPDLQDTVIGYLTSTENEGKWTARLKAGLENGAMDAALIPATLGVFRMIKAARAGLSKGPPPTATLTQTLHPNPADDLAKVIGDPNAESLRVVGAIEAEGGAAVRRALGEVGEAEARAVAGAAQDAPIESGRIAIDTEHGSFTINPAAITDDQEMRSIMAQMAETIGADIKAKQGTVPQALQREQAADLAPRILDIVEQRPEGQPLSAPEAIALNATVDASDTMLRQLAQLADQVPTDVNLYAFKRMMNFHAGILMHAKANAADASRAFRALGLAGGAADEMLGQIEGALDNAGGRENMRKMARVLQQSDAKTLDRTAEGASWQSATEEFMINMMLGSPKTWGLTGVNMLGNASTIFLSIADRLAAGLLSAGPRIGRVGGHGGVELAEGIHQLVGVLESMQDAFSYAARAFRRDESGFESYLGVSSAERLAVGQARARGLRAPGPLSAGSSASKGELSHDGAIAGWLKSKGVEASVANVIGAIANVPTKMLGAQDELFKVIQARGEAHALAYRQAMSEARAGDIKPRDVGRRKVEVFDEAFVQRRPQWSMMRQRVDTHARRETFTLGSRRAAMGPSGAANPHQGRVNDFPGNIARAAETIQRIPVFGRSPFGVPFARTPGDIMRYTFQRTPLAPLFHEFRAAYQAGGRDWDIAQAKLATGMGIGLLAYNLGLQGRITGWGPSDPQHRASMMDAGWRPGAVLYDGVYYQLNRLDPIGSMLLVAAGLADVVKNAENTEQEVESMGEAWSAFVASIAGNVLSKSYLQGISTALDVMNDADSPSRFEAWIADATVSGTVSNLSFDVRKIQDPNMRYTWDLISEFRNRLPGLSDELPVQRDVWGRERSYQSGLGQTYDTLSPLAAKVVDQTPIEAEILEQGWEITAPNKTISIFGRQFPLRNRYDVYSRFLEIRGQEIIDPQGRNLNEFLSDIVSGDDPMAYSYNLLQDGNVDWPDAKQTFIKKIIASYSRAANQRLVAELVEANDPLVARAQWELRGGRDQAGEAVARP